MKQGIKNTKMGSILFNHKVIEEVTRFLITTREDLSYEITHGKDYRLALITGKNDAEKELPVWNHPMIIKREGDVSYIAVDLRGCVRPTSDFHAINDIVSNEPVLEFELLRAIIMLKSVEEDYEVLVANKRQLMLGLSLWMSKIMTNGLRLDPLKESYAAIVIAYYILFKIDSDIDKSDAAVIIKNANVVFGLDVRKISLLLDKVSFEGQITVDDLGTALTSALGMGVNMDVVYDMLTSTWYGHNSVEVVGLAMEDLPTLLTLMYMAISNKSYRKTKLTNIYTNASRTLESKDFVKRIEQFKEENIIE